MRSLGKQIFSILLLSVFLSSCTQDQVAKESKKNIKIREASEPASINPFFIRDEVGQYIAGQIFQPLLAIDYQSNQLVGVLAEDRPNISSSEDWEMIIEYRLRSNSSFNKEQSLSYKDILYSIKANVCPLINPYYNSYYQFIDSIAINEADSNSFTIFSHEKHFLSEFTSGDYYILAESQFDPDLLLRKYSIAELKKIETVEDDSIIGQYAQFVEEFTFKEEVLPMGSGAYTIKQWKDGEGLWLERKSNWWADGNEENSYLIANAEALDFYFLEDATIAVNALKNQEFDLMRAIPAKSFKDLQNDPEFQKYFELKTAKKFGFQYLGYNLRNQILQNRSLRKAISYSLPKSEIIEKLYYGYAEELISLDEKEVKKPLIDYQFNIDSAQYYLKRAKEELGNVSLELGYAYNAGNESRKAIGLILKESLKELGIELNIEQYEWKVYLQKLRGGEFDLFMNGIVSSSFTPDLSNTFHSKSINGGRNYFGYNDPASDSLMDLISVEFNDEIREELYAELKYRINKELPLLVLYRPYQLMAFSKELKNANAYQLRPNYWAAELSK